MVLVGNGYEAEMAGKKHQGDSLESFKGLGLHFLGLKEITSGRSEETPVMLRRRYSVYY